MWSNITDVQIEEADDDIQGAGEDMFDIGSNFSGKIKLNHATDADFKEEEHPRDPLGRFASNEGIQQKVGKPIKLNADAREVYKYITKKESAFTNDMKTISKATGYDLSGLEYRIKSVESVLEKVERAQVDNPNKSQEEIV